MATDLALDLCSRGSLGFLPTQSTRALARVECPCRWVASRNVGQISYGLAMGRGETWRLSLHAWDLRSLAQARRQKSGQLAKQRQQFKCQCQLPPGHINANHSEVNCQKSRCLSAVKVEEAKSALKDSLRTRSLAVELTNGQLPESRGEAYTQNGGTTCRSATGTSFQERKVFAGGVLPSDCGLAAHVASAEGVLGDGGYFDFLVIGSGIAGLRFALDVAEKGTVAVVTKSERQEGSTNYAQGGVSAVLDPRDSVENHIRDTIVAGAYLNDEEVVEVVCREGPERVRELMEMGASFDRGEDGQLQLAREGGHSHHRIVHAADVTGREIQRALLVAAQRNPNITLFEHHFVVDLVTSESAAGATVCYGADALDVRSGQILRFLGGSTLLASGGAGHVYPNTTNPLVATGDGVALAQRAGAVMSNMEFVQFHPTALADQGVPRPPEAPRANAFLITEAVRGAGGVLYNQDGERFMGLYDERAELAPRDVVARSIDDQLKRRGEQFVWLDISHRPTDEILSHFPNIAAECMRCGIDITREPIPVVPAAHYMCGGVQTGLHGETSISGLWAAGEVACTGLHGANRLASNSLLEALVFAQRAVGPAVMHALQRRAALEGEEEAVDEDEDEKAEPSHGIGSCGKAMGIWDSGSTGHQPRRKDGERSGPSDFVAELRAVAGAASQSFGLAADDDRALAAAHVTARFRKALQGTMWDLVGIVRSTERLRVAQARISALAGEWVAELEAGAGLRGGAVTVTVEICEMRNLLAVAALIVESALQRQESRGLHFTVDYPEPQEGCGQPPTVVNHPGSLARALGSGLASQSSALPVPNSRGGRRRVTPAGQFQAAATGGPTNLGVHRKEDIRQRAVSAADIGMGS